MSDKTGRRWEREKKRSLAEKVKGEKTVAG